MLELAVGEAEIAIRRAQQWTYMASLDDTPDNIASSPPIRQESIQEAVDKLERVLSKGSEEHQEVCSLFFWRCENVTQQSWFS